MANWWTFPVSQGWNPPTEYGIDLATPFHTAITALLAGKVTAAGYHPWGGEVDIATQNGLTEYALHLDQIDPSIVPGAQVNIGQLLGLSGGQLSGGSHPTAPQYSSGPHVEYGLFQGAAWSGKSIDPTALVKGGVTTMSQGGADLCGGLPFPANIACYLGVGSAAPIAGTQAAVSSLPAAIAYTGASIGQIPTTIGHGLADFFVVAEKDIADWFGRQAIAFFVAAVVLFVLFAK